MAIKPPPELIQCPNCSWQMLMHFRSDALVDPRLIDARNAAT